MTLAISFSLPRLPLRSVATLAPGLMLTALLAWSAQEIRRISGQALISPALLALLLGVAARMLFGAQRPRLQPGARVSLRPVLRLAVALLGLQLTWRQAASLGLDGAATVLVSLIATLAVTLLLGRLLGVDPRLSKLIAAGCSICGASAVLAAQSVTRAHDEDAAYAVVCVTLLGGAAMLLYPLAAGPLGLDAAAYGLWAGASLHEVAQAVGAAFAQGEVAGGVGTVAKLSRVALLAPVMLGFSLSAARGAEAEAVRPPLPWFVFGFVALIALNSAVELAPWIKDGAARLSGFGLTMAMAAMGLECDLGRLRAQGLRPFLLTLAASLCVAGVSLALILGSA